MTLMGEHNWIVRSNIFIEKSINVLNVLLLLVIMTDLIRQNSHPQPSLFLLLHNDCRMISISSSSLDFVAITFIN